MVTLVLPYLTAESNLDSKSLISSEIHWRFISHGGPNPTQLSSDLDALDMKMYESESTMGQWVIGQMGDGFVAHDP